MSYIQEYLQEIENRKRSKDYHPKAGLIVDALLSEINCSNKDTV